LSNGLSEVLDALSLLRQRDPPIYKSLTLVFIGDGPNKAQLVARSDREQHDRVVFYAPVEKAAALAAMQLSDFVLIHFAAAAFKGYGMSANKLFDAMAVGRPVLLATPLHDTPVDTVGCGIRYDPGSVGDLADSLRHAASMSAADRQAMGKRGYVEALRTYNLEVTGRQLEELLTATIAHPRDPQ
jgi:glycosyltransferase involved in cell wall biosynthesis